MYLHAAHGLNLSESAIIHLIMSCSKLQHLDIFDNKNISESGRQTITDIARGRKLTVVLKGLTDPVVAPPDPKDGRVVWQHAKV